MSLKAVLTVGWHDDVVAADSALRLFAQGAAGEEGTAGLQAVLARERPRLVRGLDRMFRLRVGGFGRVQAMAAALHAYAAGETDDVYCHIDAFAYAFLRAAKNLDLFLPEETRPPAAAEPSIAFRRVVPGWADEIAALREFERVGREIPPARRDAYLALRRLVGRSSARDERKILMMLVVSGPSTIAEISEDLGLSYSLGDRIFGAFEDAGAVRRAADIWAVREEALPPVLFCLEATMGMDYLGILGTGG